MDKTNYITQLNFELGHLKWLTYFQSSLTKNNEIINPNFLCFLKHLRYSGVQTIRWRKGYKYYSVYIMDDAIDLHLATPIYQNIIKQPKRPYGPQRVYRCVRTVKLSQIGREYLKYIHDVKKQRIQMYKNIRKEREQEIEHHNKVQEQSDSNNPNRSTISLGIGFVMAGFIVMIACLGLVSTNVNLMITIPTMLLAGLLVLIGSVLTTSSTNNDDESDDHTIPSHSNHQVLQERSQEAYVIFMSRKGRWRNLVTGDTQKRYEVLNHSLFRKPIDI